MLIEEMTAKSVILRPAKGANKKVKKARLNHESEVG